MARLTDPAQHTPEQVKAAALQTRSRCGELYIR